jgi:hypothetical protein
MSHTVDINVKDTAAILSLEEKLRRAWNDRTSYMPVAVIGGGEARVITDEEIAALSRLSESLEQDGA